MSSQERKALFPDAKTVILSSCNEQGDVGVKVLFVWATTRCHSFRTLFWKVLLRCQENEKHKILSKLMAR